MFVAVQRYRPSFFAFFPTPVWRFPVSHEDSWEKGCTGSIARCLHVFAFTAVSSHPAAGSTRAMGSCFSDPFASWLGFIIPNCLEKNKILCKNFMLDFCSSLW